MGGGGGAKERRLDRGYRPKKTGVTVDRRQLHLPAHDLAWNPAVSVQTSLVFICAGVSNVGGYKRNA